MSNKNEMVRGGIRFGPGGGSTKAERGEMIVGLIAKVTRLEARLRLAEEVCEAADSYREMRVSSQVLFDAVRRWRKARGK